MSVQPNPQTQVQVDVEAGQSPGFGSTGERFMPLDGEQHSFPRLSSILVLI